MSDKRTFEGRMLARIKKVIKNIMKFITYKWVLPIAYKWYSLKPIDNKLVVFADQRDREIPDNFISLHALCVERGYRCVVLSGKSLRKSQSFIKRIMERAKYCLNFMKLYSQSRAVFLVEQFPLADIVKPRKGTDVVQLWHGCGLMKCMGYAVKGNSWGASEKELKRYPIHTGYTLVCSSSPLVSKGYQKAFHCDPDIIKPIGNPRTDIYYDEEFRKASVKKVHELFPGIGNRKIILYAPTFRGKSVSKSYIEFEMDFRKMKAVLGTEYVFMTKFHPLMAKGGLGESAHLRGPGFVYDATKVLSPEEALCAADILVTDYSSIIFEYMLLERPIVSYIYDIDSYCSDRGLFYPYDQLAPGPYTFNQEELVEALSTVGEWFDVNKIRKYRKKFMSGCDGHSTERIYHMVFEQKKQDNSFLNLVKHF